VDVRLRLAAHRPGFGPEAGGDLLSVVRRVGSRIGLDLTATSSSAAGSSAFAAAAGTRVLDGMGPSGGDLMTTREWIDVESLWERSAVLAGVIHELSGAGPAPGPDANSGGPAGRTGGEDG
jgi:glutamate carboxypeptidase